MLFSDVHGVSRAYAGGVSAGFEHHQTAMVSKTAEFDRGVSVGAAAYDFFCGDD